MKYKFYSDPGHGWLEVPMAEIDQLNLRPKISRYSYISRRGNAYLEEDCDASVFIEAKKEIGQTVEFEYVNYDGQCFIRSMSSFPSQKLDN